MLMAQSTAMVECFLASGYTELDTAYMYCDGKSEEIMGRMACLRQPGVTIATKANPFGPGGTGLSPPSVLSGPTPDRASVALAKRQTGNLRPESVVAQLTTSLQRLQAER
jgi:aryl-alcohol dehydrogenase-like predicted oxidoreductase